ncbi:MAG: hypothetical protein HRU09_18050 [Oligoflexales bacterium]|nr:hypothetical protein [Oligoflexales bacterium]
MGVFERAVKKAKSLAEDEIAEQEKNAQKEVENQQNLINLFKSWYKELTELIIEANEDIRNYGGEGQFFPIKESENIRDGSPFTIGFGFQDNRFLIECHKSFDEQGTGHISEFVYYFEKSAEKFSIKADEALKPKPFLINGSKPSTPRDFFVTIIADAMQWWKMIGPFKQVG